MFRMTKELAKKGLANVPEELVFRCRDGRTLRNLRELEDVLAGMGDEAFAEYVGEGRNEFGRWVRDITGDDMLASGLEKSMTREQAIAELSTTIAFLESKAA